MIYKHRYVVGYWAVILVLLLAFLLEPLSTSYFSDMADKTYSSMPKILYQGGIALLVGLLFSLLGHIHSAVPSKTRLISDAIALVLGCALIAYQWVSLGMCRIPSFLLLGMLLFDLAYAAKHFRDSSDFKN